MLRFFRIHQGLLRELEEAPAEITPDIDWIDAISPDDKERELLGTLFSESPPASEIDEIEASARYFIDKDGLHVHSLFLNYSENRHNTVSVGFILQQDRLITIRDTELADFRLLRLRARNGQLNCPTPVDLLVTVLDQKVETHADNLEDIHQELGNVSHTVLEETNPDFSAAILQLARLEDSNGKMRLCLLDTQRDISFLLKHLKEESKTDAKVETNVRGLLFEISRDIETLMSHTDFLFNKINFLMDSTHGFINSRQSQIIKIFSITAVVFLPPTVIASIYGMNFEVMPELGWLFGYPMALVLIVASGIAPYLYFKRKDWL